MYFVYVLRSIKNERYYIGSTNDLNRRLLEHNSGKSRYDKINSPYKLLFHQEYSASLLARRAEIWLKKQKSKILIDQIIKDGKINKVL